MTKKMKERMIAIGELKALLKPGDTVYTILRHCSRSGMSRVIDLQVMVNNEPRFIGWTAAVAMGDRYDDKRGGIVIGGCGMDMGFALVYNLASVVFADGFTCPGPGCPSADHSNGDRNYEPHEHAGVAGGYALRQRWL
jgi:hypothetical protein